jgi:hypothetical protein
VRDELARDVQVRLGRGEVQGRLAICCFAHAISRWLKQDKQGLGEHELVSLTDAPLLRRRETMSSASARLEAIMRGVHPIESLHGISYDFNCLVVYLRAP